MKERAPRASIIIPTYNSSELLASTLRNLARQAFPTDLFEVIVADDGSSDDTESVIGSFTGQITVKYFFQEDRGFRVAAARNGGARLASAPLLIFLDNGSMVGPDFVASHLAAHGGVPSGRAVVGLSYGYNPEDPMPGVDTLLLRDPPEVVMRAHKDSPAFQDIRNPVFAGCGFDLSRLMTPWVFFLTGNCSVGTEDFWQAGGFDESIEGWGGEDLELGYRLHHAGIRLMLDRRIWAVVFPHDRDIDSNDEAFKVNLNRILAKFPEPEIEVGWGVVERLLFIPWEDEVRRLADWRDQTRDLDVSAEIAQMIRDIPAGQRIAVLGCGGSVPAMPDAAVLIDFDAELLERAVRGTAHSAHHAVGIRTILPDNAVDTVIVTSRMTGIWPHWTEEISKEIARIGRGTRLSAEFRQQNTPLSVP
jgi:glycosyltransferase involved in cell wall biosynthesis